MQTPCSRKPSADSALPHEADRSRPPALKPLISIIPKETEPMALPSILQNLALPVMASPMFIVSYPELVLAQCKAGIVGAFPTLNARHPELLDEWLTRIAEELSAFRAANPGQPVGPLAVNQIVHQSNTGLERDVRVCIDHKVPIFITSLQAPVKEILDAVHGYGASSCTMSSAYAMRGRRWKPEWMVSSWWLPAQAATRGPCPLRAGRRSPEILRRPAGAVGRDCQR